MSTLFADFAQLRTARHCLLLIVVGFTFALAPLAAHADFVMLVDDPMKMGLDFFIEDNDSYDQQPLAGLIGFEGTVGGIQLSVTGESKGAVGSVSTPQLQLNLDPSAGPGVGSTGGMVDIILSDTDFDADFAKGVASIDVNGFGGSFDFMFFGDTSNHEFGMGFEIASTDGPVSPDFETMLKGPAQPVGSLTILSRAGFTSELQAAGFQTELTLTDAVLMSWCNMDSPFDVNNQEGTSPLDALLVINELNERQVSHQVTGRLDLPATPPPFLDVNNDSFLSPIDVLLVINHLPATSLATSNPLLDGSVNPVTVENSIATALVPEPSGWGLLSAGALIWSKHLVARTLVAPRRITAVGG